MQALTCSKVQVSSVQQPLRSALENNEFAKGGSKFGPVFRRKWTKKVHQVLPASREVPAVCNAVFRLSAARFVPQIFVENL